MAQDFRSKSIVRGLLDQHSFRVEDIGRADGRTADFFVSDEKNQYLVEVIERGESEDYRDFVERARIEGADVLVRTIDRHNGIDAVIDDKADQLRETEQTAQFRVPWITMSHDDAAFVFESLLRTLYGLADLGAAQQRERDDREKGAHAPRVHVTRRMLKCRTATRTAAITA